MPLLDRVVFVLRQSPDWSALAGDYAAGGFIAESRYKPSGYIEGFPGNITECIQTWNATFPVDFFQCRAELKDIALAQLRRIERALIIPEHEADRLPELIGDQNFLLFFMDDDDWFSSDTFGKVSGLELNGADIAVFPLVRFDVDTFTFVRGGHGARSVMGHRREFTHRFQTNNYALSRTVALSSHLMELRDHCAASYFANASAMTDAYFDLMISATNKTPCSASLLPRLVEDPQGYASTVRRYVDNLAALEIPDDMSWCRVPLDRTIRLFGSLL